MRPHLVARPAWVACLVAAALAAGVAAAEPRRGDEPKRVAVTRSASRRPARPGGISVGSPSAGRLRGGVELASSEPLRLRRAADPHWALPQLVALLERSAQKVDAAHPGSVLLVGDLSRRGGGEIAGHHSHESGRDADVGFYFMDARGRPVETRSFLQVRWDGRATRQPALRFDDARNWTLIAAWLTNPRTRVMHIFVAEPIRQRLLLQARKVGAYLPLRHRAAIAMKQPGHALPHDDHFHVRIACPRGQGNVCEPEADPPPPRRSKPARRELVRRTTRPARGAARS